MSNIDRIVETGIWVNGESRPASGGAMHDLYNPARPAELVGRAAAATAEDVNAAVEAAHAAFPTWADLGFEARAALLRQVAAALTADEEDVKYRSRLFTREHGKIARETLLEMSRLGDRFMLAAAYGERMAVDERMGPAKAGPPFDTIITRQPRGVAALIVPWNWPLSILGAKLPQALVAGNTVVVKPAQNSSLAPMLTLEIIARMLPPGVVNVITGSSGEIGDALTGHPLVRKVNFTGSVPVGRHVMKVAAENLTPVTLELGGNDAALMLDDIELDEAAFDRMYWGAFGSSGQICMALKRMYVHESRYDEVIEGFTAACERAVVGDGLLPETTMGPVNNARQLKVVTDMIAEARAKGAEVRECGQVPDEALYAGGGYFQKPTIVYNADPGLSIVREEQFGPCLPIMTFRSDEEAIALANDSAFGLCSSVWTPDPERALRVARRLEAGYTYLNGHGPMAQDGRGPFGGFKNSGIGRNLGYEGVLAFTEAHSISGPGGFLL
ncbi:aldehyde dehydrogenase family protein [Vannielia litorea]|uniref:aldehyde dehydrogenase (NAD(+)) n=1 Tax=Vannielia litorea TaxID=1217970 RepID=A0A1N6GUN8_9RHOB|nr:aldehyde dehydrogenase family protein [Vannielia litorea]SIO11236.1 Acyl-CoA reductase [Vannielia litorea]